MTSHALASRSMRGRTQEHMLRRRDAAGAEADMLAKVMQDPDPDPGVVTGYIRKLLQMEHIAPAEARHLLATVPHDPDALRDWARAVFATVMHEGIHAHAAFPREVFPSPGQPPEQAPPQQPVLQQAPQQAAPPQQGAAAPSAASPPQGPQP